MREAYGRTTYGQGCLLARRLVEAASKFVTVYFPTTSAGRARAGGWDTHGFNNTRMYPIIEKYHCRSPSRRSQQLLDSIDSTTLRHTHHL